MIPPGAYVEFFQDKRLISAVCLRQDKPGQSFVRTDNAKDVKLVDSKAMFVIPGFIDPNSDYEDIAQKLKAALKKREELAASLDIEELWELVVLEEGRDVWSLEELTELATGEQSAFNESALFRAIDADKLYFYRKGESYIARTESQVQEIVHRREVEDSNRRDRQAVQKWLQKLWYCPCKKGALVFPEGFEQVCQKTLYYLMDVAVNGSESRRSKDVSQILKDINISGNEAPFKFLVNAGLWREDENILLHKLQPPIEFSPSVLDAALELKANETIVLDSDRMDLTDLYCFTIDDASTTDYDDALSFEEREDGTMRVGIHIADASHYVTPDSILDNEALARGTAIYLPDLNVPMLPRTLSDQICSLRAGENKYAISFLVEYNSQFEQQSIVMCPSVICVKERLTYDSADEFLLAGRWAKMAQLAQKLCEERQKAGAFIFLFPRVNVKVDNGNILIERDKANQPSQRMVSEMMILANRSSAEYLASHNAAGIFRAQEAPEKPLKKIEEFDAAKAYALRRFLRKGTLATVPSHHYGLGLDFYTQVTSPIRRYSDLLMQRQLKSLLVDGIPLYSAEMLEEMLHSIKMSVAQADSLEKDRRNYWILRYLEDKYSQEMEAVVVANHPDKHIVQLTECLWETECPHVSGCPMPPGTHLHVRIDVVWPRDQIVRVSPIV